MMKTKRVRAFKPAFVATFATAVGGAAAASAVAFGCAVTATNPPFVACPVEKPVVGAPCDPAETPAVCTYNARCGGGGSGFTCTANKWAATGNARAAAPACPSARPVEGSACLTGCGVDTCTYPATRPCTVEPARLTDTVVCSADVWKTEPVKSCNPPRVPDDDGSQDAAADAGASADAGDDAR